MQRPSDWRQGVRAQAVVGRRAARRGSGVWCAGVLARVFGAGACLAASAATVYVHPHGDDGAAGTAAAPYRTPHRAQEAARLLQRDGGGEVEVCFAPGDYPMDRPLEFTPVDSGRDGARVVYRSAAGPGKARLLGSRPLTGWQPHGDGIWKIPLPPGTVFHTLYESGRRAHKARFPDRDADPRFPTALGGYLVTVGGSPEQDDRAGRAASSDPGWLAFRAQDLPPVTTVTKMRLHIYPGGKRDWVREVHRVTAIDPENHRLTFARQPYHGVGAGCRFFLEDELGFLNAPGEFFLDEGSRTLYYMPFGEGHPDALGVTYPILGTLVRLRGASGEARVENLMLDGLALAETDNVPPNVRSHGRMESPDKDVDGALIRMQNTSRVVVRNCHLRNSGRNGILMVGHNTDNLVTGCLIEHAGQNGITLFNRFPAADGKSATPDRCERNRIHNTRVSHVGELHTYAECLSVFNASNNEVDHCQLDNSVRYAITMRGNTGPQYEPPVTTVLPPTQGNRFHHIRVFACGQDGGDMGALHAANLNNPGGDCVNTFEQITVDDTRAVPSVQDIPPNGVFLDWPKMAMHQVFRHIHIARTQGTDFRSHGPENGDSAEMVNVSWEPGFRPDLMEYAGIGLTDEFPVEFGGRPPRPLRPPAPRDLAATAVDHRTAALTWSPPAHAFAESPLYTIYRDGEPVAAGRQAAYLDEHLREGTVYRYEVAVQDGEFCLPGDRTAPVAVQTPPDRSPPVLVSAWSLPGKGRVRLAFSKPMALDPVPPPSDFALTPDLEITAVHALAPDCIELEVPEAAPGRPATVAVSRHLTDTTPARNRLADHEPITVTAGGRSAAYSMHLTPDGLLLDHLGGAGDAVLHGKAMVQAGAGPFGGPALILSGESDWAEASADFPFAAGDFTIMLWLYGERGITVLSKGSGFGSPAEWNLRWSGGPGVLRVDNRYYFAPRPLPPKRWTHVALVRRGSQGFAYVNGEACGGPEDISRLGALLNDKPLRIGRRHYDAVPTPFIGRVAGVELLDGALEAAAIQARARGR